jgi:hypothetical protein
MYCIFRFKFKTLFKKTSVEPLESKLRWLAMKETRIKLKSRGTSHLKISIPLAFAAKIQRDHWTIELKYMHDSHASWELT